MNKKAETLLFWSLCQRSLVQNNFEQCIHSSRISTQKERKSSHLIERDLRFTLEPSLSRKETVFTLMAFFFFFVAISQGADAKYRLEVIIPPSNLHSDAATDTVTTGYDKSKQNVVFMGDMKITLSWTK